MLLELPGEVERDIWFIDKIDVLVVDKMGNKLHHGHEPGKRTNPYCLEDR